MKPTLQAGLAGTRAFHVGRDSTIGFMGEDARVYATPMLVRDIEIACRDLLLEHLDSGEDSVGTRVEIDHLAPSLEGADVSIEVKLGELNGRAAVFEVNAFEEGKPIGGTFTVKAGELVYIGHFGLDCYKEPTIWRYYPGGREGFAHYKQLIKAQYPFLDVEKMQFRLFKTAHLGRDYVLPP